MNYFKILGLLFWGIILSQQAHPQSLEVKNFKLFVNLENAPFDSLYLHDYTEGRNVLIAGKKIREFTWVLTIPDSIVSDSENMQLFVSRYSAISNSSTMIRFITKRAGKEIIAANVGLDDKNSYIYGTYLRKSIFPDQGIPVIIKNKDTVVKGNVVCEDFNVVVKDDHSDIVVRSEDPFFSWFIDPDGNRGDYDDHLTSYIELSRRHPDSRFLMTYLAGNLIKYRSKDDVKRVYENLSGRLKNTIWAKKIERFLYEKKFPDTSLPTLHKKSAERIVQDVLKYNLIVFIASWCVPCREEIPLLKKIYGDLGKNLIITYVSIDNLEGVPSYRKLIEEERIPWRSLLAYEDVKGIKLRYFIEGIPQVILVYPDQGMETMDIRKDNDLVKLYSLVKSLTNKKNK